MDDGHFEAVIVNASQPPFTGVVNVPQIPPTGGTQRCSPTGGTQLSHGFVRTTSGVVNTHFGPGVEFDGVDFGPGFMNTQPLYNEADIFTSTVSPLLLRDLRTLLGCLLQNIGCGLNSLLYLPPLSSSRVCQC